MIQIRKSNGQLVPVPDAAFVEIVGDDGGVGMVFCQAPGMIIQVLPGSVDAARYEDMFRGLGVKFHKTMVQRR